MSAIWGSTFAAQQIGMLKGLGPMTFNGLRFALGAFSLVPLILWRKKRLITEHTDTPFPWLGSIGAGLFLFAAAGLQQVGLQYTSSANAGFITGLYILFVPLIGLLIGQSINRSLWIGVLICIAGLYLLSFDERLSISKGDLLILICAGFWAGQILVIDRIANKGVDAK